MQTKKWRHFRAVFTENIPRNILYWNRCFELLDFWFESYITQNIISVGLIEISVRESLFQWRHNF